jgi:hypothetical protein
MAKIPLNYFKRLSFPARTMNQDPTTSYPPLTAGLYEAPFERASVVISALVSNPDPNNVRTVSAGLSTRGTPVTPMGEFVQFLSNFPIPPNDTVNIVVNKLVLGQYDNLYVWETQTQSPSITLTLSVLETVNTQ